MNRNIHYPAKLTTRNELIRHDTSYEASRLLYSDPVHHSNLPVPLPLSDETPIPPAEKHSSSEGSENNVEKQNEVKENENKLDERDEKQDFEERKNSKKSKKVSFKQSQTGAGASGDVGAKEQRDLNMYHPRALLGLAELSLDGTGLTDKGVIILITLP